MYMLITSYHRFIVFLKPMQNTATVIATDQRLWFMVQGKYRLSWTSWSTRTRLDALDARGRTALDLSDLRGRRYIAEAWRKRMAAPIGHARIFPNKTGQLAGRRVMVNGVYGVQFESLRRSPAALRVSNSKESMEILRIGADS